MSAGGAEQTIETLVRAGLVDDRRLALRRAAFLAGRGLGDEAIAAKLDAEGIRIEERRAALATLEPEERRAVEVARREAGRPVVRIAALLARRGFGEDAVEAAVASLDASRRPGVP
jgi:SOS response regulatory protein OraA/RecX